MRAAVLFTTGWGFTGQACPKIKVWMQTGDSVIAELRGYSTVLASMWQLNPSHWTDRECTEHSLLERTNQKAADSDQGAEQLCVLSCSKSVGEKGLLCLTLLPWSAVDVLVCHTW